MKNTYPNLEALVATDLCGGIAKNGSIPWHNRADLAFFKKKTETHVVIMGMRTLLSLPNKHPLPNRLNVVLTNHVAENTKQYSSKFDNVMFLNLDNLRTFINETPDSKLFVIGGNQTYELLLKYCSKIWVTVIKEHHDCDTTLTHDFSQYRRVPYLVDDAMSIVCYEK
jgi:dihydrofolate reductase